ncbi:hypothetical protein PybrP1_012663 [[Pythium] brassicae (nom. inval.)]|nr:hypothetical protein PybrP1_012663 [[Pythium] brassicae (nom. inval.)]
MSDLTPVTPVAKTRQPSTTAAANKVAPTSPYGITLEELRNLNHDQMTETNVAELQRVGGVTGLANLLCVNPEQGLPHTEVETGFTLRRDRFGTNVFTDAPMKSLLRLFYESLQDTTLIILIIAAIASLVTGYMEHPETGWSEGVAIITGVFLVALVTSVNNYSKEKQFRALSAKNDDVLVKVIRCGKPDQVQVGDINVGDVIILETGDKVPADAILIRGQDLKCNESSLTGEPDDVKKTEKSDPFLLSSCLVASGRAECLVIAVGPECRWGKIKSKLVREQKATPLMEKLEDMAKLIGYVGMFFSVATMVAMIIIFAVSDDKKEEYSWPSYVLHTFLIGVTIIVVAIPEGLPLAAFKHKQSQLPVNKSTLDELAQNIAVNTSAFLKDVNGTPVVQGNKTEGAMLIWMHKAGFLYDELRAQHFQPKRGDRLFPFSSEKKTMSAIVKRSDGSHRLYTKGAAEVVLAQSVKYINKEGNAMDISAIKRAELNGIITKMADSALRTICISHRDFPSGALPSDLQSMPEAPEEELVVSAICGIQDPLRPDVTEAIRDCKRAGIMVRMVTGDNIHTATAIAKQCGIMTAGGVALEGPVFRKMTVDELNKVLPHLQVLARSSPDDKYRLFLQFQLTVNIVALIVTFVSAVTGREPPLNSVMMLWINLIMDTMGALALGTEAPTEALLDRRPYKKSARLLGRGIVKNILCQAVFQLALVFILLAYGHNEFGFPEGNTCLKFEYSLKSSFSELSADSCITASGKACSSLKCEDYVSQTDLSLNNYPVGCLKAYCTTYDYRHYTVIFNTFVFSQLFNEFNARRTNNDWRVFSGVITNPLFIFIIVTTIVVQVLLAEFGGNFTKTSSITFQQWLICFGHGALSIPVGILMRFIPISESPDSFANPNNIPQ